MSLLLSNSRFYFPRNISNSAARLASGCPYTQPLADERGTDPVFLARTRG
jgi:hypothetical protein